MIRHRGQLRFVAWLLAVALVWAAPVSATQTKSQGTSHSSSATSKPAAKTPSATRTSTTTKTTPKRSTTRRRAVPVDPTKDDIGEFDDPMVREIAVEALGHVNGSVVAVDPTSGRILAVVNQRLAFSAGFQPCSTIKPVIAVAALSEGIITRDTMIKVGRRTYMNLTEALAHSNNPYFEALGKQLGFETVSRYARQLGLGEPAGYNIFEEHPGLFPETPPLWGGVGKMSSFGEGIHVTPLQLASLAVTLANGGTVYYLQYPRTEEERQNFTPRIKRKLELEAQLPELREGMLAAVLYGTARRGFDSEEQILGKTGTCSDQGTRLGWFLSYNDQIRPRLAVAVLLRGYTRRINGSTAADIAGHIYQRLRERNYFAQHPAISPVTVAGTAP